MGCAGRCVPRGSDGPVPVAGMEAHVSRSCCYCGSTIPSRDQRRVICGHPICKRRYARNEPVLAERETSVHAAVARLQEAGATPTQIVDLLASKLGLSRAQVMSMARARR